MVLKMIHFIVVRTGDFLIPKKKLRISKNGFRRVNGIETGISKSALGSYEKDDYKEINHGNLILLADFYGVSLDYLFYRTENRAEINTPLRELHLKVLQAAWYQL